MVGPHRRPQQIELPLGGGMEDFMIMMILLRMRAWKSSGVSSSNNNNRQVRGTMGGGGGDSRQLNLWIGRRGEVVRRQLPSTASSIVRMQ